MTNLTIGTATARPGEIVYGEFDAVGLPTGGRDFFPVIIAQGKDPDGPVMWLTTGIHGSEHSGVITVQQLLNADLVSKMRGTIVAITTLSPGGLRTKQRSPYYASQSDPNRLFPRPDREQADSGKHKENKPPSELEQAYLRIFDCIASTQPACLLDLHNAWIGSIPFVFRDPVFYHKSKGKISRADAQSLNARLDGLLNAFGFTVVNEYVADDYVSKNLHRSVSGSVLNGLRIPATTIELGSWMHVEHHIVRACLAGLRNVMRWLEMLPGGPERIEGIPVIRQNSPVRRYVYPYAPKTGIVHHIARPGDPVRKGQPLLRMCDIYGRPLFEDDGLIRSEHDGFVMAWHHGVVHYQGDPLMDLAIHDDGDMIVPYPE